MSDYTSPPNSYELYHGQGQGQGYYPSHQESTMPEQKYYNSASQPHNQPEFASAAPDYPPPYRGQTPQDYHLGPGSECLPRVSNQDNEYVPYHAEQHQCSGENASYYAGIPQDQVNGVGTVPGVGPERDGERGLGSTFIGGAAGGYAGHKMHGGFLGTAGGADLGAAGMNMVSHEIKDHRRHEEERRYAGQFGPGPAEGYGHLHHRHERGRGRGLGLVRGRGRGRGY